MMLSGKQGHRTGQSPKSSLMSPKRNVLGEQPGKSDTDMVSTGEAIEVIR
jgi:hypothetical protein